VHRRPAHWREEAPDIFTPVGSNTHLLGIKETQVDVAVGQVYAFNFGGIFMRIVDKKDDPELGPMVDVRMVRFERQLKTEHTDIEFHRMDINGWIRERYLLENSELMV
jgi:hypothetical protein